MLHASCRDNSRSDALFYSNVHKCALVVAGFNCKPIKDLALWLYIYRGEGWGDGAVVMGVIAAVSNLPGSRWNVSFSYAAANYYIGDLCCSTALVGCMLQQLRFGHAHMLHCHVQAVHVRSHLSLCMKAHSPQGCFDGQQLHRNIPYCCAYCLARAQYSGQLVMVALCSIGLRYLLLIILGRDCERVASCLAITAAVLRFLHSVGLGHTLAKFGLIGRVRLQRLTEAAHLGCILKLCIELGADAPFVIAFIGSGKQIFSVVPHGVWHLRMSM